MMLYLNSDEIPADHQSLVLAPRTRRVTIQSRPIHVPFKKGRDRLTGYVEWQIKYGRADVEPFEFTHLFNLRGDVEAHLVNGGWETRWAPFDDSEVIVEDEHTELMLDEKGQFSRKR